MGHVDWDRLFDVTGGDIPQLVRVLLAYYRRIKDLAKFEDDGKVKFL